VKKNILSILQNNKILKHFAIYFVSGGVSKAIPFLVLIVIANYLTTEDYGIISNFFVLSSLCTGLISMKLSQIFQAEYHKLDQEERNVKVSSIIYLKIIIGVLLVLLIILFSEIIEKYTLIKREWLLIVIFIALSNNFFELRSTLLRLEEKPKVFATFQITNVLLTSLLTLLFIAYLDLSWQGRIYSAIITSAIMLIITIKYIFQHYHFPKSLNTFQIAEYFKLGVPFVPQTFAPFFRKGMDKILITNSVSLGANGVYSMAISISTVCEMIIDSLFATFIPNLYKQLSLADEANVETLKRKKKQIIKQIYRILVYLSIVLFLMYLFFTLVVKLFLNENYHSAILYLPLLIVSVFLTALYNLISSFVMISKKTTLLGTSVFLISIIHAALSLIAIPFYGVYGALWVLIGSSTIKVFVAFYLSEKYYPMPWF
jgi:O-antigen/teichoic acid export membrane protein